MESGNHLHQHRYHIRSLLGKGGMGAVYLAEDLNLAGRLVAIKENLNDDEEAQRQFRREAVLLAHLRHPNLPQVIDYFLEPGGRQYLVMEYIPGENLHDIMRAHGPLPVSEALTCIDQVMQAVAYMHNQHDPDTGHRRAIVHRDIKPANIKRTPEGRYVLVDFGIAKLHSATLRATAVSARALTPGFAPIEQYGGGTDERTDIYALGATLYTLLTAKTPPSSVDLAAGVPLPSLRSANSKVLPDVAKAVERAMKVNANERFASVDEMYTAVTGRPIPTKPITTSPTPLRPSPRPSRRLAWLFGMLAFASVVGAWWLFDNSETAPSAAPPSVVTTVSDTPPVLALSVAAEPTQAIMAVVPTVDTSAATIQAEDTGNVTAVESTQISPTIDTLVEVSSNAPTNTRTPAATLTPTLTPLPTSTPLTPPTPRSSSASATPRPAAASRQNTGSGSGASGPQNASIIYPGDNHSSDTPTKFKWMTDAPLALGQEFEIIFWRAAGGTEAQGRGILRSSVAMEVTQPVDKLAPDAYKWALILVQTEPSYQRIRRLAGPFNFTVPGEWNPYREPD